MPCVIKLHGWPTAVDCVKWSEDGLIAVGLTDRVAILIPDLSLASLASRDAEPWYTTYLQVNTFTQEEWPMFDPLPWMIQSIGEEQSHSHVVSLAWSPPGVARHKRCALAVLTANHVLSIWSSDTNPRDGESWTRVLVINHALKNELKNGHGGTQPNDPGMESYAILGSRIRSFAWGPPLESVEMVATGDSKSVKVTVRRQLLVLSTDLGDLVVVEVQSPHQSAISRRRSWSATVITRRRISAKPIQAPQAGDIHRQDLCANIVRHLAWSHCMYSHPAEVSTYGSLLAYLIGKELCLLPCRVQVQAGNLVVNFAPSVEKLAGDHEGPIRLMKQVIWQCSCYVQYAANGLHRLKTMQHI